MNSILVNKLYKASDKYFKRIGFISKDLNCRNRGGHYSQARSIYTNILNTHTFYDVKEIGNSIGVNHSTIKYYINNKHILLTESRLTKMLIELQSILDPLMKIVVDPFKDQKEKLEIMLMHNCL